MRQLRRKPIKNIIKTNKIGKFIFPEQLIIYIYRDGNSFLLTTQIFGSLEWSNFNYLHEWEEYLEDNIQFLYQHYTLTEFVMPTNRLIEYISKWKTVKIEMAISDALELAQKILIDQQNERVKLVQTEAKEGIQYED